MFFPDSKETNIYIFSKWMKIILQSNLEGKIYVGDTNQLN